MTDKDQQNNENSSNLIRGKRIQVESMLSDQVPAVRVDLDGDFKRLAPQSLVFEQRTGYVVAGVVSCIILIFGSPVLISLVSSWSKVFFGFLGWMVLAGLLLCGAHVWPKLTFRNTRWRLNETGLEIQRGVWWKHQIAVPTARVQHVDVSQGPVQRLFELGTLTIHTAGTSNASVELTGLEHSQALRLRDRLIEQKESLDVT